MIPGYMTQCKQLGSAEEHIGTVSLILSAITLQEALPAFLLAQARQYVAPQRLEFSEDVSVPKVRAVAQVRHAGIFFVLGTNTCVHLYEQAKEASGLLEEWKAKKEGTEGILKLMQAYKDLGDSKSEVSNRALHRASLRVLFCPVPG